MIGLTFVLPSLKERRQYPSGT